MSLFSESLSVSHIEYVCTVRSSLAVSFILTSHNVFALKDLSACLTSALSLQRVQVLVFLYEDLEGCHCVQTDIMPQSRGAKSTGEER